MQAIGLLVVLVVAEVGTPLVIALIFYYLENMEILLLIIGIILIVFHAQ